jgi:uncharacterized protein (TIGR04222 family)
MNPLDWSGPEFLALYVLLLVLSLKAAIALRWGLRQPGGPPGPLPSSVDPYEVALLRGRQVLVEAAMASLVHQKLLSVEDGKLAATGKVPFTAPLIERIVHASVEAGESKPWELLNKVEPAIRQLRVPLEQRGWLMDDVQGNRARYLPLLPVAAVLMLGFAKLLVGVQRDRPVAFLVMATFLLGLVSVPFLLRAPWRSRLGDQVLNQLRMERQALRQLAPVAVGNGPLNAWDVILAVGLFGLMAVLSEEFDLLRRHLGSSGYGVDSGSSSDFGGSDGGGDGDGGGGGGCGGCGGGCGGGD